MYESVRTNRTNTVFKSCGLFQHLLGPGLSPATVIVLMLSDNDKRDYEGNENDQSTNDSCNSTPQDPRVLYGSERLRREHDA